MNGIRAWRWILAAVILAGLAWQGARLDASPLRALAWPSVTLLGAALAFGIASSFLQFRAWVSLRAKSTPLAELAPPWFASLLARYVPGGVWQGLTRVAAAAAEGESKRDALEHFAAEVSLACCSAAVLALVAGAMGTPALGAASALLLAVVAAGSAIGAAAGSRAGLAIGWTAGAWGWMLAAHAAMACGFALLVHAWFALSPGATAAAMSAFLAAGIAGVLAIFVPAGLGVREAVLAGLLAPSLGMAPAIALALAARVWLVAGEVLAWGLAVWLRPPSSTEQRP